jgi:hypothetical protein
MRRFRRIAMRTSSQLALFASAVALAACGTPSTPDAGPDVVDASVDTMRDGFDASDARGDSADEGVDVHDATSITDVPDVEHEDALDASDAVDTLVADDVRDALDEDGETVDAAPPADAAGDVPSDSSAESCMGTVCDGTCIDTQSDVNHCGDCTTVCPAPTNALRIAACTAGTCGSACNPASTVCTVSSTHPTIQAAVDDVCCLTIEVPAGTYLERLTVARDVTIHGSGAASTFVDGGGAGSVLQHTAGVVTVSSLTLQNGQGAAGGGAITYADLTLDAVTVTGNTATNTGGGVAAARNASLTLQNGTIVENNNAPNGGGGLSATMATVRLTTGSRVRNNHAVGGLLVGGGGGIFATGGTLVLDASFVENNTATYTGSASVPVASGGGIYSSATVTTLTNGSGVSGNSVSVMGTPAQCNAIGGGIFIGGAALSVSDSSISNNTVTCDVAGGTSSAIADARGGGVNCMTGSAQFTRATIAGNAATVTSTGGSTVYARGAGFFGAFQCAPDVTESTIDANEGNATATSASAGNLTVTGGGICVLGQGTSGQGTVLRRSTVSRNTLSAASSSSASMSGSVNGGGIYVVGMGATPEGLVVVNSTVSGNTITASGSLQSGGGGVFLAQGSALLASATVTNNTAPRDAGLSYGSPVATATVRNTILAGNVGGDCPSTSVSQGYNVWNGCTATGVLTGNVASAMPGLAPLADNGGPTMTHALSTGSPAIDGGDPAGCRDETGTVLTVDQRGHARSGRCDVGAFEQ